MKIEKEIINNNLYALQKVWSVCRSKIISHMAINFMQVIFDFINGIYFLRTIIGIIEGGHTYKEYIFFVSFVLVLNTIRSAANAFYYYYLSDILNNQVICRLNSMIFRKAASVELKCFEDKEFFESYHWAVQNVERYIIQIINNITSIVCYLFLCIIIIIYTITIDPIILIFAICPIIVGIFSKKSCQLNYQKNIEVTSSIREKDYVRRIIFQKEYAHEMRMTDMYLVLEKKFNESISYLIDTYKNYGVRAAVVQIFVQLFSSHVAFMGACFYSIYRFTILKNLSVEDFSVLVTAITTFNTRVSSIVQFINYAQGHSSFIDKLRSFLNYEPSMKEGNQNPNDFKYLDIKNASFSYSADSRDVLSDINLRIIKGEKIAIVGHNGAGKSTLIKLLLRLYDTSRGYITYNGLDIKDFFIKEYRKKFGVVFQDNTIFALNVAENVLMDDYNQEKEDRIISSLEYSGVGKIVKNKKGILTNMTKEFDEEGLVLSGGQKQKLFIARLFAQDFNIAILDEPSSALDPISEHDIYEKLIKATKGKTVIFVSHRLSSATLADRIVVLNHGRIAEVGTHDELMKLDNIYAFMYNTQAENYITGGR